MSDRPLAYHITFGTYGTRLHGDPRGTVDRTRNKPGDPIIGHNYEWYQLESSNLNGQPVIFDQPDRVMVERGIDIVCERGGWLCHAAACQPNHIHILITSIDEGKLIRRLLKRWLSQYLNECDVMCGMRPESWWAKGGSVKWVWDQGYLDNLFWYVNRQRISTSEPRQPRRGPPCGHGGSD